ncbi:Possible hydrolase or acyltransferase RutD in novel pyrimidine catabolism pathway [Klebsiella pneumoniae subsp. pneumoniae ST512-K30BO]|uniref:Hydrolase n=1 Tax=Klebsiella pneumoniae subsp. pneumoniae (strain HS11286) TaxID=1125630 RepID=A0A0H3GVA5_KLEPH|nr:hydrolase or acyltransferase RutD in novel pyrimidine catabolism pathway [Klebsiella pneumoniae]YP_005226211.1 putative hydrolase [Klebsiella pneumoniae subsp. pneumoniae HS11286]AEW60609.1 putative hydrolase [Klebsiella pneumoniae subsp. pneumoniae HS11286]CCM86126.1 Possible hydrolase or acyltransferase RutD in novel pyrimidine catabolism pathway [Klebsiella pneumoniae subsp. pneumoniae ST258-K28BO]CCM92723.1 Possible hydrolase or acyltransferase RutD in novel pyrimidine catabolism pathway
MMRLNIAPAPWPGAPVVVLSAGLGGGGGYWLAQRAALEEQYQLVSYDHNGTGENAGPLPAGYRPGSCSALCRRRGSPASRWWATPWGR